MVVVPATGTTRVKRSCPSAAVLPDVDIRPAHLQVDGLPDLDAGPDKWVDLFGVAPDRDPHFVMLADPYSFPVQNLLMGMDYAYPKATKIGGLASGASREGGNALFLDGEVLRSGAIGLALDGNITVDTVVAQGCRPIGKPMRISKSERNMLLELDDVPPMEVLRDMLKTLPDRDQDLIRHSLFLGVVMDELIDNPVQGDFLIRNVVGMDQSTGALAIGEMLIQQCIQLSEILYRRIAFLRFFPQGLQGIHDCPMPCCGVVIVLGEGRVPLRQAEP